MIKRKKPYVVYTIDGDYFFSSKKKALAFCKQRKGFFDTVDRKLAIESHRKHLKEVVRI